MKSKRKKYISIDKRFLTEGHTVNFEVYETNKEKNAMTLFLQSDSLVDGNNKVRLREIEKLYITEDSYREYEEYVNGHLQSIAKSSNIPLNEKVTIVYENATRILDDMFENPESLENLKKSKEVVGGFIETILSDSTALTSLMKITAHDYYTHTHSINVGIYSLCLGKYLGVSGQELENLGTAALLHDIGKSKIDAEIINKNGSLTEDEFATMKHHSALGYEIAKKIGIEDRDILSGIRHHHEKQDGYGYPDGIEGDNLSNFARIIGVCDVFDALTTKRSYKDPFSSFEALSLMKKQMSTHLDMELVNSFVKMLQKT
ncbi:MAG: HD-GYP domain-containing protein [Campylobacterota bacterium]|nr:HD-GYP domain-containing protein [Campylobacterota bacterium]